MPNRYLIDGELEHAGDTVSATSDQGGLKVPTVIDRNDPLAVPAKEQAKNTIRLPTMFEKVEESVIGQVGHGQYLSSEVKEL
ncbi:uncharacterized protein LTR77_010613 [Saxophila tyrrhenica]|uniref:Uncharacterized protein n=1 Tax=Saxophila tyrrhenica TaxID=1690608 RepID=A0AAV9NV94_9PEZI|nr:hypothetical protein LTR77_010613 [Saxophila tyrrhenica]